MKDTELPATQYALQLVGPGELKLNHEKAVVKPGPYQVLARVEAVGLCFSDLKLLKQFSSHARKGEIIQGLPRQVLEEIPSYVPGTRPTVPGHEVACRIVAAGAEVRHHRVGERCLVQTDYRDLRTANSNAAFGYNFEGGLQEYVLMDERVIMDRSSGERFLIPVDEALSASAVALVEPWACVEDSYVNPERQAILPGGRLLVVAGHNHTVEGLKEAFKKGKPGEITVVCSGESQQVAVHSLGLPMEKVADVSALPRKHFDDIVYYGSDGGTIESLNDKLAARGIINIVLGGQRIGQQVSVGIGRIHYDMTRWIGTEGTRADESYATIPESGEVRPGEQVAVIGAAGPMGQMHVIRNLCLETAGVGIVATDIEEARLNTLLKKVRPLAEKNRVPLRIINTREQPLAERFSYFAILVPAPGLVADAISSSLDGCLINVFAGIPATVCQKVDLDTYIRRLCYMFGTSGSVIRDMKLVLNKVGKGLLDPNRSVDAISGMAGAVEALAAVENRTLAGKILVYPMLHDVGLIPLSELASHYPAVSEKLQNGQWNRAAEDELLRLAATSNPSKAAPLISR